MQFYWVSKVWHLDFSTVTDSSKHRIISRTYLISSSVVNSLYSKNFLTVSSACLPTFVEIISSSTSLESSSICTCICCSTPSSTRNSSKISSSIGKLALIKLLSNSTYSSAVISTEGSASFRQLRVEIKLAVFIDFINIHFTCHLR